jgi:hypothetical protein
MDTNAGALAGSISLGFFLGCAGPLGKLMGIPFDIRHITNLLPAILRLDFMDEVTLFPFYLAYSCCGSIADRFSELPGKFFISLLCCRKIEGYTFKRLQGVFGHFVQVFQAAPKDFIWPPAAMRNATEI